MAEGLTEKGPNLAPEGKLPYNKQYFLVSLII